MFLSSKKAFTLIELLIVITIIGIIAGAVLVGYNAVQIQARDKRRAAEMAEIKKSLMAYYTIYGHYPDGANDSAGAPGECNAGIWDIGNKSYAGTDGSFIKPLIDDNIVKIVPQETRAVIGAVFGDYCTYKYARYECHAVDASLPQVSAGGKYCAYLFARCEGANCPTGETPSWCDPARWSECPGRAGDDYGTDNKNIFYILME